MTEFKVGDKVKIVSNKSMSCNKIGDIGYVKDLSELGSYKVYVEGNGDIANWHTFDELELVEEQMTDSYNEENVWYGWNGGECPVDPETWVHVIEMQIKHGPVKTFGHAKSFNWSKTPTETYGNVVAFRITKLQEEKPEMMTIWGVTHGTDLVFYSPEKENCEQYVRNRDESHRIVKFQTVES